MHPREIPLRSGADIVVESLRDLGVEQVFGLPGQNALGLFDALDRNSMPMSGLRVENNVAFAADGYARTSGRTAVLALSTGPGALTSLGALQEAWATCVPLLVLVSQIPRSGLGGTRRGMLHQLDDQQASAQNVSKRTYLARTTGQIRSVIHEAWVEALTPPCGPVWVELPEDVLLEPVEHRPLPLTVPSRPSAPPDVEAIAAGVELLERAQLPVILAGGGIRRSHGGAAALLAFAERMNAPVVETVGGRGVFPQSHPLFASSWIEDRHTTDFLQDADVLIALGTSFGEITSNYYTFAPRGRIIQVDADYRVLESNHPALAIHADAAETLSALTERLPMHALERSESGEARAAQLHRNVKSRFGSTDFVLERSLLNDIRSAVPDDAHTFWDMTVMGYWAWSAWDARAGGFHSAQGAGGLGFAFPAAIGGAIGSRRRTLAVSGDGGAMYSVAELAAALQSDASVTWLIIDDGGYGILREYMVGAFGRSSAVELARPDFVALGKAFGVRSYSATVQTVGAVIAKTFASSHTGPTLVHLAASPQMFPQT